MIIRVHLRSSAVPLFVFLCLLSPLACQHATLQPPAGLRVVRVIDGDTIIVRWRGMDERVRLLNIDAPERNEDGYDDATDALRDLIGGRPVVLEWKEPDIPTRGRFGRLLAFVIIDGLNINVEMVRSGHAMYYTKYGKGRYAERFAAAALDCAQGTTQITPIRR